MSQEVIESVMSILFYQSHWVYLQQTKIQYAGSETGRGSNAEQRFDSYVLLDIL